MPPKGGSASSFDLFSIHREFSAPSSPPLFGVLQNHSLALFLALCLTPLCDYEGGGQKHLHSSLCIECPRSLEVEQESAIDKEKEGP